MILEEHYPTVVIGAGPAGIMAARYAAARGPVLLVDCMTFPRMKSCGGMLNEYSQEYLKAFGDIPQDIVCDPEWINFRFYDWDRKIKKGTTLRFANVNRKGFDEWLLSFLPTNVTLRDNTRFLDCTQDETGVTVTLRDASNADAEPVKVNCDYLVGCDGPRSTVRRQLPVSQLSLYKTLQEIIPLEGSMEPYFDCLYSRNIGKDYGYGYLIPKDDIAIVGSVFYPGTKNCAPLHQRAVEEFSSYYPYDPDKSVRREAWTAVKVRSVADIVGGHGRVLLCGDAGGIMSPSSGEGISFALNSGRWAGMAIAELGTTPSETEPAENSLVLMLYRELLKPIKRNIARRLRYFPVLDSDWGKWLGGSSPKFMVDIVAHRI